MLNPPQDKKQKLGAKKKFMSTQITILGNTGRDVELRYTPNGTPVAGFSIASNSVRNTPSGQEKKTDWFNVSAYGKQAETLAKYARKGTQLLVRGKLNLSAWTSRDGEARYNADITLQDFEFAGAPVSGRGNNEATEMVSAEQNGREEIADAASESDETRAEMRAALNEYDGGDEPFAGQY